MQTCETLRGVDIALLAVGDVAVCLLHHVRVVASEIVIGEMCPAEDIDSPVAVVHVDRRGEVVVAVGESL